SGVGSQKLSGGAHFCGEFREPAPESKGMAIMAAAKPVPALFTEFKVFSGTANSKLSQEICEARGCPLGASMIKRFADGETHLQIQENVRGADVFLVQPTCSPVDHHLM